MISEKVSYFHDDIECLGFIAYEEQLDLRRPCILVAHAWRGQDDFAREKAIELAQLGYVGFAIDIYGDRKSADDSNKASKLMAPYYLDRKLLQKRVGAAVSFIKTHPMVNPSCLGAIGFCFGGLAVYELLRSGIGVNAVCCFHGVFSEINAKTIPISPDAKGHLLILHGHQDPLVTDEDLRRVQEEMTTANIDWQIHIYGKTMHAFTNPKANDRKAGKLYCPISAKRAWDSMQRFFDPLF